MKRKLKHLGMLALAMGIFTGSVLMHGNKKEVQAGEEHIKAGETVNKINSIIDTDTNNFDNPTDAMYYSVFGENFKLMQEASEQINKTAYYDGIRMEVLSTITITQEDSTLHTSYTFLTIQDVTSNNRLTNTTNLSLQEEILKDDVPMAWGRANFISFDEETQTMTFVAIYDYYNLEIDNYLENVVVNISNISSDYTIDTILINNLNICDLISKHNASVTNNRITSVSFSPEIQKLDLGADELFKRDTLKKDELSIPISGWDTAYISNVAYIDGLLHIQASTPERYNFDGKWYDIEWYDIGLIDNNSDNLIWPVYTLGLNNIDEYFNKSDDRVYREFVFIIDDIENINNYSLNLDRYYYSTNIDTELEVSFTSPVLKYSYKTAEETEILINDDKANIDNVTLSIMGINFTIDELEVLKQDMNTIYEIMENNLDVTLIYNNRLERDYPNDISSLSWSYGEDKHTINNIQVNLSSAIVDIDNLVAININGSIIEVN